MKKVLVVLTNLQETHGFLHGLQPGGGPLIRGLSLYVERTNMSRRFFALRNATIGLVSLYTSPSSMSLVVTKECVGLLIAVVEKGEML